LSNRTLIIEKATHNFQKMQRHSHSPKKQHQAVKSRQFSAELLAYVTADSLWPGGQADTDNLRPIWAMLGGSEQELRAFVANLQLGHLAAIPKEGYSRSAPTRFEFLKSGGYRYVWHKVSGLTFGGQEGGNSPAQQLALVTIYQPELFRLDPGMVDPELCRFVMLPPLWWVERELARLREDEISCAHLLAHARALGLEGWGLGFEAEEILSQVPAAAYFAAYLDRRTQKPIPDSLDFYLQLYFHALREGIATLSLHPASANPYRNDSAKEAWGWARHKTAKNTSQSYLEIDTHLVGLASGVAVNVTQARLDKFLAEQVRLYFETVARNRHSVTLPGSHPVNLIELPPSQVEDARERQLETLVAKVG
jgi:hypothetical protein